MQGRDWLILGVIVAVAIMVWVLAGGTLIIGSGRVVGFGGVTSRPSISPAKRDPRRNFPDQKRRSWL